jgi:deoxyribose-phosphate aldolase
MITSKEAARFIDISAVRTRHTLADIETVVAYGKQYNFINVHVLPNWVKILAEMLKDARDVYVGAPVGFPGGGERTEVKLLEAKLLIEDGVEEMDIMMNVGRFKNREYDYVLDELKQIIALSPENVLTKVIIELNALEDDEIEKACELVISSKADFLKTGTGWIPGDANISRIKRIIQFCDNKVKIKAAGGVRTPEEFLQLLDLGVKRFGINTKSAIEIVEYFEK